MGSVGTVSDIPRSSEPSFVHGEWIRVFIDPDPRGGPGYVRIVEGAGSEGVVILPLRGTEIGMVRLLRRPFGVTMLELPRGFADGPGRPAAQAARELLEETGLRLHIDTLVDLGTFASNTGISSAVTRAFAARVPAKSGVTEPVDVGEIDTFSWIAISDVWRMIDCGDICDGFTLATLLKAQLRGFLEVRE